MEGKAEKNIKTDKCDNPIGRNTWKSFSEKNEREKKSTCQAIQTK